MKGILYTTRKIEVSSVKALHNVTTTIQLLNFAGQLLSKT